MYRQLEIINTRRLAGLTSATSLKIGVDGASCERERIKGIIMVD
jgi:hypothetical protein